MPWDIWMDTHTYASPPHPKLVDQSYNPPPPLLNLILLATSMMAHAPHFFSSTPIHRDKDSRGWDGEKAKERKIQFGAMCLL